MSKLSEEIRELKVDQNSNTFSVKALAVNLKLEAAAQLVEKHEAEVASKIGRTDYTKPTPETAAFMLRIDDSEIDLSQVEDALHDMECERDHYKELCK